MGRLATAPFFSLGLCLLLTCIARVTVHAGEFISGADFSHLAFFESKGIAYKDGGEVKDALEILKGRGLTCVRLRLFTSSAAQAQANPYNYINNLDYTLPLAVRVKNAGLKFLLDFHYSDTWADPAKQAKPSAWTNLTFSELKQQIRLYSSNCIVSFRDAGAMPDYVQVGNEITGGTLWTDGKVGGTYDTAAQWLQLAQLLTNAMAGIRDAAGPQMPKLMIHIDRGGDWAGTQWFFDHLQAQGVAFDFIGLSYYPWWHGSLDNLRNCVTNTAQRYGKPVILAETAFPWTNSTNIYGIPATPDGQVQFVAELAKIMKRLPANLGAGIFWWGAEYQSVPGVNLGGFDQKSFFDAAGNALPVVAAFGQLVAPVRLNIRMQGTNVLVQWPLSGAGADLFSALWPADTNNAAWTAATNQVETTGAWFSATAPSTIDPGRFFRLQSD